MLSSSATASGGGEEVTGGGYSRGDAAVEQGVECGTDEVFLREKFMRAFGSPLLNHEGGPDSEIRSLWWEVVALRGKQYVLPNGSVGTRFVNMLSEEIELCTEGWQQSEREFLFTALVLQRDKMVRKGKDIRPLLTRQMDMWETGKLPELLQEAKRCDKQMVADLSSLTSEQLERTFNRLMMEGRIRSVVRLVTERGSGGVLDLEAEAHGKNDPLGTCLFMMCSRKNTLHRELLIPVPSLSVKCCRHLSKWTSLLLILRQWQDVYLEVQALVVQARSNGEIFCFVMEQQVPACMKPLLHLLADMLMKLCLGMT